MMLHLRRQVSQLTAEDLHQLVDGAASETSELEFKAIPYAPGPDGSREFLKDASALANGHGGLLLLGIREEAGVAVGLDPIHEPDHDSLKQRLESLLRSGIQPPLRDVLIHKIEVNDGYVLAIQVPQSAYPPHRVSAQNSNRFYLRHSAGVYEASMDELRALFNQGIAARERLEKIRRDRLKILEEGASAVHLFDGNGRFTLHIAPLRTVYEAVNLTEAFNVQELFRPLHSSGYSTQFNVDGFATYRGGTQCHGYTQIFRDGLLEATKVELVRNNDGQRLISGRHIEDLILAGTKMYLKGLDSVGVTSPWVVMPSLQGVLGAGVTCSMDLFGWDDPPQLRADNLLLPACLVTELGDGSSLQAILKPALDALWNAAGLAGWHPRECN